MAVPMAADGDRRNGCRRRAGRRRRQVRRRRRLRRAGKPRRHETGARRQAAAPPDSQKKKKNTGSAESCGRTESVRVGERVDPDRSRPDMDAWPDDAAGVAEQRMSTSGKRRHR